MTTDLLRSAAAVHAWLDEVGVRAGEPLDDAELGSLVGELERIDRRVASARLRVLAAASKADTAHRAGAASTSAWVATLTTCDPRAAFRDVRLAEEIEESPTVGQALGSGAISSSHATVIMNATRLLPSQVTPAQRVQVEESLVEKARTLSPSRLRVAARRALGAIETDSLVVDAHENELLEKEETSALARASLSFRENGDGTGSGHFTLPTLQFGILRKVVETITAPRRGRLGASQAQAGRPPATDWDHARGLALVELIEHLPTDHLHPATAATVVVTMDESVLQGRLRAAGVDTRGTDLRGCVKAAGLRRRASAGRAGRRVDSAGPGPQGPAVL